MGWESRGNRRVYYEAARVNGRVVKRHVPALMAPMVEQVAEMRRREREASRQKIKAAKKELADLEAVVGAVVEVADVATRAAMLAAGYRKHNRGEWRKQRGK